MCVGSWMCGIKAYFNGAWYEEDSIYEVQGFAHHTNISILRAVKQE